MKNLRGKPFAIIGVNIGGHDARALKRVMDKEGLTWRSFADSGDLGQGRIATRWNLGLTPTLYLIDHVGVIRHKWVGAPGERLIDAAVGRLVDEAEKGSQSPPE